MFYDDINFTLNIFLSIIYNKFVYQMGCRVIQLHMQF